MSEQTLNDEERLVALMLHNTRNLGATLRLQLDALGRELAEGRIDSAREIVEKAKANAERLASMHEHYRVLIRAHSHEETSISPLLTSIVRHHEKLAPETEFTIRFDADLQEVTADANLVGLCIEELVQNALKAMSSSGRKGAIAIAVRRVEDDEVRAFTKQKKSLAIDVVDNGPGITPLMRESLFSPGVSTEKTGAGFGLFACRAAARAAGGEVYYNPTYAQGTKFTLVLPLGPTERQGESHEDSGDR